MYDYYDYTSSYYDSGVSTGGIFAALGIYSAFIGIIGLLMLISMWKIFKKAGKPGWASIVPIYNIIVLLEITGLPLWYIVLFIVPIANIYAIFKIYIELAHKFGKSTGFGVAMVFFSIICLPILAFSKCEYEGIISNETNMNNANMVNNNVNQVNTKYINNVNQGDSSQFSSNTNNYSSLNGINNQMVHDSSNVNINANSFNQVHTGSAINNFVPTGDLSIGSVDTQTMQSMSNSNTQNDLINNQPAGKRCPNCGKVHPITMAFCDNCGQQL